MPEDDDAQREPPPGRFPSMTLFRSARNEGGI